MSSPILVKIPEPPSSGTRTHSERPSPGQGECPSSPTDFYRQKGGADRAQLWRLVISTPPASRPPVLRCRTGPSPASWPPVSAVGMATSRPPVPLYRTGPSLASWPPVSAVGMATSRPNRSLRPHPALRHLRIRAGLEGRLGSKIPPSDSSHAPMYFSLIFYSPTHSVTY